MKKLVITIALGLTLSVPFVQAKTLTIALDKSGSNPLLTDVNFAASAAQYAETLILRLREGDTVRIRSFGARDTPSNLLSQDIPLTRHRRSQHVAAAVKRYIATLPSMQGQSQSSTNIVAFLEFDTGFDCVSGGTVLALTDGLEASEYISPDDFKSGKAGLPKPDVDLAGCEIVFYGLGSGLKPKAVKHIRNGWRAYFKDAGAQFSPVTF
jgi:hypothetical protein